MRFFAAFALPLLGIIGMIREWQSFCPSPGRCAFFISMIFGGYIYGVLIPIPAEPELSDEEVQLATLTAAYEEDVITLEVFEAAVEELLDSDS